MTDAPLKIDATVISTLMSCPLFEGLEEDDLRDVARLAQPFEVKKGSTLFKQSDTAQFLYIIGDGSLEALVHVPGQDDRQLSVSGRGDVVGELALIEGNIRSATVRALENTNGVKITRHGFLSLQATLSPTSLLVMRRLCAYLARRLRYVYGLLSTALKEDAVDLDSWAISPSRFVIREPITDAETTYLARLPFFKQFDRPELEQLLEGLSFRRLDPGELIITPGGELDALYVSVRGAIEATLRHGELTQRVRLVGPGAACNYLSLVDEGPNPLACRARERTMALEIPRARFDELFYGDNVLSQRLIVASQIDLTYALRDASRPPAWMFIAEYE